MKEIFKVISGRVSRGLVGCELSDEVHGRCGIHDRASRRVCMGERETKGSFHGGEDFLGENLL